MPIEIFKYMLQCGIDERAFTELAMVYGVDNNPEREYAYALYMCEAINDTYYLPEGI